MAKAEQNTHTNGTLFKCDAPDAKQVFVAGTFNDWDPLATKMERSTDGSWRTHVELAPGRYEYKFVVDDRWCCEPVGDEQAVPNCVCNEFGTMNRVIEVSASR